MKFLEYVQRDDEHYGEQFPVVAPILKQYFDYIGNHDVFHGRPYEFKVFSDNRCQYYRSGKSQVEPVKFDVCFEEEVSFDDCGRSVEICVHCVHSTPLFARDRYGDPRLIGCYCRLLKSFNMCDFTHWESDSAVKLVKEIIKKFNLKPRHQPIEFKPPKTIQVILGCDPELELIRHGEVIEVDREYEIEGGDNYCEYSFGAWGCDGAGTQLELRPAPSCSPKRLVRNLHLLIDDLKYEGQLCLAGLQEPLGGHIHISLQVDGRPMKLNSRVIGDLDYVFGGLMSWLNTWARTGSGYGQLGDYRLQLWGVEWRVPPATYLLTPRTAYIMFRMVKNCVTAVLKAAAYDKPIKQFISKRLFCEFVTTFEQTRVVDLTDIRPYWLGGSFPPSPWFADSWREEKRQLVLKEFPFSFTFFGLARSRGIDVVSVPEPFVKAAEECDLIPLVLRNGYQIGFPWNFRTCKHSRVDKKIIEMLRRIKESKAFKLEELEVARLVWDRWNSMWTSLAKM